MGSETSGNYGHAGRPGERGGSGQGGSENPLHEPYGGLPGGGGYTSATEYSISHQRYVEAAHCILGSLGKQEGTDIVNAEAGHVREEMNIMEDTIKEYSRDWYNKDLVSHQYEPEYKKYFDETIKNIQENSPKIAALAEEQRSKCDTIQDPAIRQAAVDTYSAVAMLGWKAQGLTKENAGTFNVWRNTDVQDATKQVRLSVEKLYPRHSQMSVSSKPMDNRR